MISIIIPIYNQAKKLDKCLASILAQSWHDYEIIIVNDGSTDDLLTALKPWQHQFRNKRFVIVNQANAGANAARNRGAREAGGELLLFCDADLILNPRLLEIMAKKLQASHWASFVYCSFKYGWKTFKLFPYDDDKLKQMPFIHTTSLLRAEHFPGFDEKIKRLQDWDLWLTMLEQGHRGVFVDQVLFKAIGGGTISTWLPSAAYKLLPWLGGVKKYEEAKEIVKKKHRII